jgi:DNA repair protein RecO (recombination protein O)
MFFSLFEYLFQLFLKFMIVTSESIVLNSRKYGDTSKIITVFSIDYGKITLIAKGSRVPRSKFGSSIEPISCSNITFYMKPNTDLYLMSNSELSKKWLRIYNSSEHLVAAFNIIESISRTQLNKNPNPELYSLLVDTLEFLNELNKSPETVVIWFFCKFAEIMGFELNIPDVSPLSNMIFPVLIESGSVVNSRIDAVGRVFKLNSVVMSKLFQLIHTDIDLIEQIDLSNTENTTLYNFFGTYFSYHFESKFVLKSGNIF